MHETFSNTQTPQETDPSQFNLAALQRHLGETGVTSTLITSEDVPTAIEPSQYPEGQPESIIDHVPGFNGTTTGSEHNNPEPSDRRVPLGKVFPGGDPSRALGFNGTVRR